jgi:hypothetical protein
MRRYDVSIDEGRVCPRVDTTPASIATTQTQTRETRNTPKAGSARAYRPETHRGGDREV